MEKKYTQKQYDTLMQKFHNKEELSQFDRKNLGIGPIRINRIQCKQCKDIITSHHLHDFKWCKCKAVAIDGGSWYLKRIGNLEHIIELSENYKDAIIEDHKLVL